VCEGETPPLQKRGGFMTKQEKIEKLISMRLAEMDWEALEGFYVDIKTEEFEQYDDDLLDELLAG
jgi:hypothetical protein